MRWSEPVGPGIVRIRRRRANDCESLRVNSSVPSPSLGGSRPWPDGFGNHSTVTTTSWSNLDDNTGLGGHRAGVIVDCHNRFHLGDCFSRTCRERRAPQSKWSKGSTRRVEWLIFSAPSDLSNRFTIANLSCTVPSKGQCLSTDA